MSNGKYTPIIIPVTYKAFFHIYVYFITDGYAGIQIDTEADRHIDRQTNRQMGTQTDRYAQTD